MSPLVWLDLISRVEKESDKVTLYPHSVHSSSRDTLAKSGPNGWYLITLIRVLCAYSMLMTLYCAFRMNVELAKNLKILLYLYI